MLIVHTSEISFKCLTQGTTRNPFAQVLLPSKYAVVKQIVKDDLTKADYVSLNSDLWTGCHNRGYLSLTVHFVVSSMEMRHYCLMTQEVSVAHNAENLAKELTEAIDDWDLPGKVYAFCTDNAKNIVNAVRQLNGCVLHLPCFGHTLQLGVQKCFNIDGISRILGKLVEHFRKSSKATYELRSKQTLLDLPKHELVQQCETRWGSVYHMLERVMEQQPAFCAVLLGSNDRVVKSYLPDNSECHVIEELLIILKPFVQATTLMSGSSYPTIGLIFPLLYKLLYITLAIKEDEPLVRKVKTEIFKDLSNRYKERDLQLFFKKCAYLDPRFKDLVPFIPSDERAGLIEAIKLDLIALQSVDVHEQSNSEAEQTRTGSR